MSRQVISGRGATFNPPNKFECTERGIFHHEGIDEAETSLPRTRFIITRAEKILSRNHSADVPFEYSLNPYQGCEHGCVYCYARDTHQYWGMGAGFDFEAKILVKENAPALLEKALLAPGWPVSPIMFSGNTDCYQPAERRFALTRQLLEVCLRYRQPLGIITKNSLILRDLDILRELATRQLVRVMISITTLNEKLRRQMEPRTATAARRLEVIRQLAAAGVPVGVMLAPVIPALTMSEIPKIIEEAAAAGAARVGHTVLRLNGAVQPIFSKWLAAVYPDRANKVLSQVQTMHGGKLHDSRILKRMLGEGRVAQMIGRLVEVAVQRYMPGRSFPEFDTSRFRRGGMYTIW